MSSEVELVPGGATGDVTDSELAEVCQRSHVSVMGRNTAEESTIIATLLLQKAAGNSSESGFKPAVWPLVVDAVRPSIRTSISARPAITRYVHGSLWCASSR